MFVSYAGTVEQFREEVVALLRNDADRCALRKVSARTKADRMAEAARETELRRQALFFEEIKFFPRREES